MQVFAPIFLFAALCCGSFASECTSGYQVIAVNNTSGSCNNSTCLTSNGTVPCCALEVVLRAKIPPCSRIAVEADQMLNGNLVVNGSSDLVLEGKVQNVVTISCNGSLSFTNCQNVNISGLQFSGCPLTFLNCINVTVTGATFSSGSIIGLALMNVSGCALISSTHFVDHAATSNKSAVGLLIHKQSSTDPGHYRISNCTFSNNIHVYSEEEDKKLHADNCTNCGGGLVVLVEGSSENTVELVDGTTFKHNTGSIGGGAYFSIGGRSNVLTINDTSFEDNVASTLGGGLYIDDGNAANNSFHVSIANSMFTSNTAPHGAGLAYRSIGELLPTADYGITLSECNFTANTATDSGGALGFYSWSVDLDNDGKQIIANLENCLIMKNSIYQPSYTGPSIVFGIGVIYTDGVNIAFSGTSCIVGNQGTAILASSAIIYMYDFVYIAENTGIRGGGVYLVGGIRSKIVVRKSMNLTFSGNYARLYGGAIFHSYPSLGVIAKYCIFEYEDPTNTDPAKWVANITFVNNTAGFSGNSIFISSPASCHVSSNNIPFTESIYHFEPTKAQVVSSPVRLEFPRFNDSEVMLGQTLELKVVAYDAFNQSVRAPVLVSLVCRESDQILPDEQCNFNLDGTRLVQISEDQDQGTNNSSPNRTTFFITGPELGNLSNVVLIWQTLENAPVSLGFLNVTIKGKCKLGFVFDPLQQKCVCYNNNDHDHVYCSTDTYTACVEEGYWYGEIDNNNNIFEAVSCPFGNCNYTTGSCPTKSCAEKNSYCNLDDNNHNALCYGNRTGLLCSKCENNNTQFTFDAIQCTNQCSSVAGSSVLVIVLVLLFWVILVVGLLVAIRLDLHIGSGQLYCFFFFFSVLQYFVGGTFPSPVLYAIELVITGFIQLDPKFLGLIPIACLPQEIPIILYTALCYVHPLFLAAVMLLLVCCSRKYRLPFFHDRRSINTICILLYLSFFSLTQTSLSFLVPVRFAQNDLRVSIDPSMNYGHGLHLVFVAVAVLVQLTLVIPFLVLLIFSPILIRCPLVDRIIHRLKPIVDEFQGCYKDSRRSFAGFYLLWRQIIFFFNLTGINFVTIYLLQISAIIMLLVHAVFQPYEKQWLNALDAFFITDLLILSILHGSTANVVFASSELLIVKKLLIFLLVLFPLAYFAFLCIWPILKRIFTFICTQKQKQLHSVYQHTEHEREPILFEQSVASNNPRLTTSNHLSAGNKSIKQPTNSVVGISSGGSYRSAANTD